MSPKRMFNANHPEKMLASFLILLLCLASFQQDLSLTKSCWRCGQYFPFRCVFTETYRDTLFLPLPLCSHSKHLTPYFLLSVLLKIVSFCPECPFLKKYLINIFKNLFYIQTPISPPSFPPVSLLPTPIYSPSQPLLLHLHSERAGLPWV